MAHSREYGSEASYRNVRKRPRDDNEDGHRNFSKRGRYSDPGPRNREGEASSPEQRLESLITRLGEKSNKSLENNLETLAGIVSNEMSEFKDKILRTIYKCVYTLSERTSVYATLVGILNAKKYDFGEELLDLLMEELKNALILMQFSKAKQLVRFLADLVNTKVVASSSVISLFEAFVMVTYEPDIPQVRSDCFVNMVLSSLPWVGAELDERKRQDMDRLFTVLESYIVKRTTPYLPAFQSWASDEPHLQSDSLEVLWVQVKAMRDKGWKEHVLLRPYRSMDAIIGGAYSHALPAITIPAHSEDSIYPLPTVVFRFFTNDDLCYESNPGCVLPANESIDRFLIEDTIHCIVSSLQANRKECANALIHLVERMVEKSGAVPMSYIIVEVLFGFLLRLPSPPTAAVYYSSVFIELCKIDPGRYPRILEQIMKLLFNHLDKMNMVSVNRLAQWFAHHLSNFKFTWDWSEWISVLQGRKDHPSVYFVSEVFTRCIRLGCYDDFVELIPAEYTPLLPPEPAPQFKYDSEAESVPETQIATKLVEAIRAKGEDTMDEMTKVIESLPSVNPELSFNRNKLLVAKVSVLTHCVLHVGSKTVSHCFLALTKFRQLFIDLMGTDTGKTACLDAVAEFYSSNSLLHCLVVDKLMRMQIVDAMAILNWFFSSKVTPLFTRKYIWDILEATILKTNRAHVQATKDLAETKEKLKKVSDLDEVAMGSDEKQKLEDQVEEMEDKVEECVRTQKDMFLIICQRMIGVLTEHLSTCDLEGVDYETTWFFSTIDNFRQILFQNYSQVSKYSSSLESLAFTPDVDSRIMEVFQQFQALL